MRNRQAKVEIAKAKTQIICMPRVPPTRAGEGEVAAVTSVNTMAMV